MLIKLKKAKHTIVNTDNLCAVYIDEVDTFEYQLIMVYDEGVTITHTYDREEDAVEDLNYIFDEAGKGPCWG